MPSDLRTTGRLVAAVAFTAVVGIIIWAVLNQRVPGPAQSGNGANTAGAPDLTATTPPPTVNSKSDGSSGGGTGVLVAGSGMGTWTRANPRTGVVESRLDYAKLTPLPGGRYELESPGAWIFSGGVARAHISAPTAKVVWPAREEPPEAGDLAGGVLVRVFNASTPAGQTPALDLALYTLTIDSIRFEGAMSQLESTDPLAVRGPGVKIDGIGLVLRFSPVDKRLQYARTLGKHATIDPAALSGGIDAVRGTKPTDKPRSTAEAAPQPGTATLEPLEMVMSGPVRIKQGGRAVESDTLTLWAMLRNGQLPEGAFAPFGPPSTPRSDKPRDANKPHRAASPAPAQSLIEVTWDGPLEFRALAEKPDQLAKDLLRLNLSADHAGGVRLSDAESGATLSAASVDYGATTRTLAVTGPPADASDPSQGVVRLRARRPGGTEEVQLESGALALDFTSGIGAIAGAGRVTSADPTGTPNADQPAGTAVSWGGRADFILDTTGGPAGAGGVFLPTRVTLTDSVVAVTPEGRAVADFADVRFRRIPALTADEKPSAIPFQIDLSDSASVKSPEGEVRADRLTLTFAETPDKKGRAVPRRASGRGNAVAQQVSKQGIDRISAEGIDAELTRDAVSGKVAVSTLLAEKSVVFTGKDGTAATAARLTAEVPEQRIELVGAPATIGRTDAPTPGTTARPSQQIAAERIKLDGSAKKLNVPGPGVGTYESGNESMTVAWKREMTYDDTPAEAVVVGEVTCRAARGDSDRYQATGDRATVRLTPAGSGAAAERALESVTIASDEGARAEPSVQVTARRYAAGQPVAPIDEGTATLEGMIDLKGPSVTVMPARRAMSVPGPGRILVEDRRSIAERATPGASPESRGTTVIDWKGTLRTIEDTGTIRLTDAVRVRHLAVGAAEATLMEASALSLDLDWPAQGDPRQEPRLKRVRADAGVFVKHQNLRFTGDALSFDAGSNEVIVAGNPSRPVTIEDAATGATSTAEAIALDPRTGTWRATNAGTIVVPR